MTTPTIDDLQAEIQRLKAHADDLLAERRTEKQRREAAESALAALQETHSATLARLEDVTLSGPVLRAMETVTAAPPAQGRRLLEETGLRFVLNAEGTAVAIDGEQEVPLTELYQHLLSKCHTSPEGMATYGWIIRSSGASGGGAPGGGRPIPASSPKRPEPPKPAPGLGLR